MRSRPVGEPGRTSCASHVQELVKQAEVVEDADVVTYVVVCDPGDEAVSALSQFARWKLRRSPPSAPSSTRPSAGSTRRPGTYRRIPVDEQCEVLSLIGDVAEGAIGPVPHMHVVLGLSDGTTRGGHLLQGPVYPTLEVIMTKPRHSCAR